MGTGSKPSWRFRPPRATSRVAAFSGEWVDDSRSEDVDEAGDGDDPDASGEPAETVESGHGSLSE